MRQGESSGIMLPNFLIIGAARSGTTTLYSHLQGHPDVYLPAKKRPEPHFFLKNSEFVRGLSYYDERYFSHWAGQRAIGEASTSYIFGPEVPKRVRACLPAVRLIAMLRNPIERAFSNYWHTVKGGLETLCFAEAVALESTRKSELAGTALGEISPFAYIERGFYASQLRRWFEEFDREQIKIVIFDDFIASPAATLAEVARFLDIAPERLPNRGVEAENKSVPAEMTIPSELRRTLINTFRDDVTALSDLLGRNLAHWLET